MKNYFIEMNTNFCYRKSGHTHIDGHYYIIFGYNSFLSSLFFGWLNCMLHWVSMNIGLFFFIILFYFCHNNMLVKHCVYCTMSKYIFKEWIYLTHQSLLYWCGINLFGQIYSIYILYIVRSASIFIYIYCNFNWIERCIWLYTSVIFSSKNL